jgi:hypothetical protein
MKRITNPEELKKFSDDYMEKFFNYYGRNSLKGLFMRSFRYVFTYNFYKAMEPEYLEAKRQEIIESCRR